MAGGMDPAVAAKTTSTVSPGNSDAAILARAQLLASHGEPQLALASLRDLGYSQSPATARLSASLLTALGQPARAESLLALGRNAIAGSDGRSSALLVRARLFLEAGRPQACLAAIAAMDSSTTMSLAAYRDLIAARALLATGEYARAAAVLERSRPHAPEAIRGVIDETRVDAYRALDNPRAALSAAVEATGESDAAGVRRLLKTRYEIAREIGDDALAWDAAQSLFERFPRSSEAQACALVMGGDRNEDGIDTGLLFRCASVLQTNGQREAFRNVLRRLDARTLTAAESEHERLLWGEYHFANGDYSRAIALARPSYSDANLRRRSMLLMARSYRRVGRGADAASMYQAYARVFPNDGLAAEALFTAASLYDDLKRTRQRDRVLDQLRHAYPSTFHGRAASLERARELDLAGAHDDAAAIFDLWLTRSRRTDEAALFYSSRERRNAGDVTGSDALFSELRALNPYSFYACSNLLMPAGERSRSVAPSSLVWLDTVAGRREEAFRRVRARVESFDAGDRSNDGMAAALDRARFFLTAGFRDWAEGELEVARRESANDPVAALDLARIFDDNAMPWRSVRQYERSRAAIPWAKRGESVDDFRYLTHPVPYPVQVVTAADREDIAPYVLYGMMREESGFDSDVVSRAGAVGLMQLMPETARRVAKRVDLTPDAGDRLGDPMINVSIGSWYAADLLREGKGSVVWMLAAYNAGPAAANQWIQPGTSGDAAIEAVESIDYRETRGYVKRVIESANVYHALYFDGASASSMPR